MTVQIVRFKDGLDVICGVNNFDTEIELDNPMMFEIRNTNLLLQHWLPLAVMQGDTVMVKKDDVLCTMDPNEDFAEYYTETVKKMKETLQKDKDSVDKDSFKELLQALTELDSKNIIKH